jgi:hypothetical protein
VMMLSMTAAGVFSQYFDPRTIGVAAGILSSLTAVYWTWADWTGRLPEPTAVTTPPAESGPGSIQPAEQRSSSPTV